MQPRESFIMISLIFLVSLFIMLVITFTLASPIDTFYYELLNMNISGTPSADLTEGRLNLYIPYYRTATIMAFALGCATPFGYVVAKVFGREPDYNPFEQKYGGGYR